MSELRPVHRLRQGGIRITSVSCGGVRPARVDLLRLELHATHNDGSCGNVRFTKVELRKLEVHVAPYADDGGDVRPVKVEMRKLELHATPYTGSYDITPEVDEQIMRTRDRHMLDDVTIRAIPYFMTSNVNGETVYIASEL